MRYIILCFCLFLSACTQQASHLPSWWQLPGALIGNTIENAAYNKKRNAVKNYVVKHYDELKMDVQNGTGEHFEKILSLAGIKPADRPNARREIQENYATLFENTDLISNIIMHNYTSLYRDRIYRQTKTINGFSYNQAYQIIQDFIVKDIDGFHHAVKVRNHQYFDDLSKKLTIESSEKNNMFLNHIFDQYDQFFIEPVVVGIMVVS